MRICIYIYIPEFVCLCPAYYSVYDDNVQPCASNRNVQIGICMHLAHPTRVHACTYMYLIIHPACMHVTTYLRTFAHVSTLHTLSYTSGKSQKPAGPAVMAPGGPKPPAQSEPDDEAPNDATPNPNDLYFL